MYLAGFFGLFAVSIFFFFFPVELTDKRKAAALAILSFVWPVVLFLMCFGSLWEYDRYHSWRKF